MSALNATGSASGTIGVLGSGNTRTVTITGITGDGTLGISIAAGTATDSAGNTAPAAGPSATFTVSSTPVAVDDSATTHLNTPVTVSVLANDALGAQPTTITAFDATSANGGAVVDNGNGTLTFTPASGFVGTDTFTYTITDSASQSSSATVSVTVTDALPVANDDSTSTHLNTPATIGVLANDNLGDQPTSITAFDAVMRNGGTVANNGDGTLTFTPASGFVGTDTFTYTITDSDGEPSTATVSVAVTDALPVANDDSTSTHLNTPATIGVLANDDLGDQPTSITAFDAVSANGGTVANNGDGTLTFTPASGFVGTDTFTYTITDSDGETSTATVSVAVTDALPVANDDSTSTHLNTPATISVLANDNLGDQPTSITAFDAVTRNGGTVANNGDGTLTFTPASGFVGTDTFTYTITDSDGETSTATVSVAVTDALPVANDDSTSMHLNTPATISVLANDDLGDQPTSITAFDATSANGGTVVNNGDGTLTFTPASGFVGTDTFTYTITDSDGETSTATVSVAVTDALPVANDDSTSTQLNAPVTISVLANDDLGDPPTSITAFDATSATAGRWSITATAP